MFGVGIAVAEVVRMGSGAARISDVQGLRHVRPVKPLRFPSSNSEWDMPQSFRHHRMCELIYQVLASVAGSSDTVGADQFIYYDASSPRRCVAPDAYVKLGVPSHMPNSWRTWEKGTPELCVEILSPSDSEEKLSFAEKLRRYTALGTRELIVFNADRKRIRAWDRVGDDFVERIVAGDQTPCVTIPRHAFVVAPDAKLGHVLRLRDAEGKLIPTDAEEVARLREELESRDRPAVKRKKPRRA